MLREVELRPITYLDVVAGSDGQARRHLRPSLPPSNGQAAGTRVPTFAAVLGEADMASVDEGNWVSNDVLEIDSALGTLKSRSAAALNDGMLAASAKLHPAKHVRIPLRLESVRRREDSHGPAIKTADENLFAGF
jgi:hypothetical protein